MRLFPKLMASSSYRRHGTSRTYGRTGRSNRLPTDLFTRDQERDYDMYSINVKPGDQSSRDFGGGIEVTTQVVQESTKHDSTSERRLVLDPS